MVRIARERVLALFALAEREAAGGHDELADRYVVLARKIGTRYNVRFLPEYRELYCRSCSTFWVEGRTVRTRLRAGRRVRTCLRCGRRRRLPVREPSLLPGRGPEVGRSAEAMEDVVLADAPSEEEPTDRADDDEPQEN